MKMWEIVVTALGAGWLSLATVICAAVVNGASQEHRLVAGKERKEPAAWYAVGSAAVTFWVVWGCLCWMDHLARQ